MSRGEKIGILIAVLVVTGLAIATQFVTVSQMYYGQRTYTANAGELDSESVFGQTFVAERDNLSGIGVMFATYSGRDNEGLVRFHLREGVGSEHDLRSGSVNPAQLGDNQFYQFNFEPISGSLGKTYFFYLDSPKASAGKAVTVDIDTQDPYHLGSAYLVRGVGGGDVNEDVLARSGKPTVDLVFQQYHTVTLREAIVSNTQKYARLFASTWDQKKEVYRMYSWMFGIAAIFLAVVIYAFAKDRDGSWSNRARGHLGGLGVGKILIVIFVLAILIRIFYAVNLPVTNDEGNYLYDARTLLQGRLAGGDGYVKAPLVIIWVAFWQFLFGTSILAGRMSSVAAGALTMFPIYYLAKEVGGLTKSGVTKGGQAAGVAAACAWALMGVTSVYSIYVHTQPLAVLIATGSLAFFLWLARGGEGLLSRDNFRPTMFYGSLYLLSGMFIALAVVSRKSILALGLVPLLIIFTQASNLKEKWRYLIRSGIGFLAVLGIFLTLAGVVYGGEGFWEALGVNSAEDGVTEMTVEEREQVRAYSIRGMTPFFRESLPIILLAVLGWGFLGERFMAAGLVKITQAWKRKGFWFAAGRYLFIKAGWVLPVWLFVWAWRFFSEYEGSSMMFFGMERLWAAMFFVVVVMAVLPYGKSEQEDSREDLAGLTFKILLTPFWVGGLVFFYANWIKFHANYLGEFLPPLVVLTGLGSIRIWQRIRNMGLVNWHKGLRLIVVAGQVVMVLVLIIVITWASFTSIFITYVHEHTGTFQLDSLAEAAEWAKRNIPYNKTIFTGAAAVPYLSGHRVALDIAHPRWYAYEFTRKDTSRLNTFLPSADEMLNAYREAEWFLLDKQTGFSFLMEYSEIEAGLERDWEAVKGIENGSNTLTFYKRLGQNNGYSE